MFGSIIRFVKKCFTAVVDFVMKPFRKVRKPEASVMQATKGVPTPKHVKHRPARPLDVTKLGLAQPWMVTTEKRNSA